LFAVALVDGIGREQACLSHEECLYLEDIVAMMGNISDVQVVCPRLKGVAVYAKAEVAGQCPEKCLFPRPVTFLHAFGNGFGFGGAFGEMNVAVSVLKASERLIMGGIRVKLAPISYLSVQYGMLTNDLDYAYAITGADGALTAAGAEKLSISKNIITADVTVNF
jgi:hypothetical protein